MLSPFFFFFVSFFNSESLCPSLCWKRGHLKHGMLNQHGVMKSRNFGSKVWTSEWTWVRNESEWVGMFPWPKPQFSPSYWCDTRVWHTMAYLNTVHTMHYVHIYFVFIKSTLNASSFIQQVTLFDWYSNKFRHSSAPSSGSAVSTVYFSTCEMVSSNCQFECCKNAVFTHDTQFLKLHDSHLAD